MPLTLHLNRNLMSAEMGCMSESNKLEKLLGMYQQNLNPRSRRLGAKNQDPNFGPAHRALYL